MVRHVCCILLLTALSVTGAYGAEKILSLNEALQIALGNNYEIKAFQYSLSAQQEDVGIARSFLLPKILFEERFMRTNNPPSVFAIELDQERFTASDFAVSSLNNPTPINDFQTTFSFEQPLFLPKAHVGLRIAKNELSSKGEDFLRKREEITLRVIQAFLTVYTAKEYVTVAQKAIEDSREHLRIAGLRYSSGLGLYSDTLRASTAVAEAEQRLVSADKNLKVAKKGLGLLLGTSESVEIDDQLPEIPFMGNDYYIGASLSRKDIRSLELRHENAKNGVRLAESGYLPMVAMGGAYQMNDHRIPFGTEGESWQLTAFLRWELFDGAKREHERRKAEYKVAETGEYLEGFKKAVAYKVYEAYLGVEEAQKNIELSLTAVKSAEEGKRLVKRRYESSLSPMVDLLDAQLSLDHTRASLVDAENQHRLAITNLSYESGTLLRDLKIE